MSNAFFIFPHQLFKETIELSADKTVYLIEEYLFFNQYMFHKQKLLFHRATMKLYEKFLKGHNIKTFYVEATNPLSDVRQLVALQQQFKTIHIFEVADNWLQKKLTETCKKNRIQLVVHPSPNFLNTVASTEVFFKQQKTYFQTAFYKHQRKQRNILLDAIGNPIGGQWTFDADNRLKYDKKQKPPAIQFAKENNEVLKAKKFIEKHYANNYGSVETFIYPTTYEEAERWLDDFLKNRFEKFGIYEDAIVAEEHYLHHAVISPLLNVGLLQPQQVIDKALHEAERYTIPLNSLEGFIRQIVGWREFIRLVYEREGTRQRTKNYWGFERKIPPSFWQGNTGIYPVDNIIKKVLKTGYCHHIERLMVLGNFMLLCEFDPNEVYRWFMELFIDAYDWVMVPNVYGMTQFADGGLMTTKPYISGSNYLLKMSDYKKGEWANIWDALFWRFMHVNRNFFLKNPRLGMLIKTFDKMPAAKQQQYLSTAETYLNSL